MTTLRLLFTVIGLVLAVFGALILLLESRGGIVWEYTFGGQFSMRASLLLLLVGLALFTSSSRRSRTKKPPAVQDNNEDQSPESTTESLDASEAHAAEILQRLSDPTGNISRVRTVGKNILGAATALLGALITIAGGIAILIAVGYDKELKDLLLSVLALLVGLILATLGVRITLGLRRD